ncbi:MAG: type II secretion system protein [Candidatus Saccharibacteria bacterium]|nr:type II secretion system protein [Candidatus Saccharibacteria bacterium]
MKCGSNPKGFTIVETLIFLAVSGALLFSAIAVMSGSQNKSRFNDALYDVQQQIDSAVNNLSTGYYGGSDNLSCSVDSVNGNIVLSVGGVRGQSPQCQFIGRMVTFNPDNMVIQSIVGLTKSSGSDVTSFNDSKAVVVPATIQTINYKYGLTFNKLQLGANASTERNIAFISAFPEDNGLGAGILKSGNLQNDFVVVPGGILDSIKTTYLASKNPSSGITVCLKSGTNSEYAAITIGGEGRSATTSRLIGTSC